MLLNYFQIQNKLLVVGLRNVSESSLQVWRPVTLHSRMYACVRVYVVRVCVRSIHRYG